MTDAATILSRATFELQQALIELYAAFSAYPAPVSLDASPLRDADAILAALRSAPLVKLSPEALGLYASSAMTTVGDISNYKHFLPRIVHLAVGGSHGQPGLEPQLNASKLEYGQWRNWPIREQDAIAAVFEKTLIWARQRDPDEMHAEGWLCGYAMLGLDVMAMLETWLKDPLDNPASMVQLARLLMDAESVVTACGFWKDVSLQSRRDIVDWLCSEAVEATLINAVDRAAERDLWLFDSVDAKISEIKHMRWRDQGPE